MTDYLKPLIWVLLIVVAALGLHLLLAWLQPQDLELDSATIGNGAVQTPVPAPGDNATGVNPVVAPNVGVKPVEPPVPVIPAVLPPVGPPVPHVPLGPPGPVALAGIDRVSREQWEKALLANGFVVRAHPKFHTKDADITGYALLIQNREAAWAFLQAGADNLVVRLEFYVDGKDSAQGVQAADDAQKAAVQIIKSFRALDSTLADLVTPVLFSPYSGKDAFAAGNGYKGYARDVGRYICLRVTPRPDIELGQFLLLWKDPTGKVGAFQNSVQFADQCKDVDWTAFPIPPEAK